MKKNILLLLIVSPIICLSQYWGEHNAVWYYNQMDYGPPFDHDYYRFYAIGDTVVLGDTVKIIKQEYISTIDSGYTHHIMKSENNRVFLFDSVTNSFQLIYDFNASQGDTISVFCPTANQDTTIKIIVDSLTYLNLNGYNLIIQYVSQPVFQEFYITGMIIENIGWTGYMFPIHSWVDPPNGGSLRCYEDSLIGLLKCCSYDCDYINSVDYLTQDFDIKVFPNPTSGLINIETENIISIEIIDIDGIIVYDGKETEIDIANLNNGVYLLKIATNEGVKMGKVVLNKMK
ncbi:MAG: T9SS type A sorting domain-containing protein [Bacteroidota bacterium]